jgi:hypothetical protein
LIFIDSKLIKRLAKLLNRMPGIVEEEIAKRLLSGNSIMLMVIENYGR